MAALSLTNKARFAALLATVLVALPAASLAATHVVTDFGDSAAAGQLRTLMNLAASGDTPSV